MFMEQPKRPPWRQPGIKLTLDSVNSPVRKLEMALPENYSIEWGRKNNPNIQGCSALSK